MAASDTNAIESATRRWRTRPLTTHNLLEPSLLGHIQPLDFLVQRTMKIKKDGKGGLVVRISGRITPQDIIAMQELEFFVTNNGSQSTLTCTKQELTLHIVDVRSDMSTYSEEQWQQHIANLFLEMQLWFLEVEEFKEKEYEKINFMRTTTHHATQPTASDVDLGEVQEIAAPDVYIIPRTVVSD